MLYTLKDHVGTAIRHASRPIAFALVLAAWLFPCFGHALTLQEGLKIVTESGRDVAIARSDEDVARGAVTLARSPWLPWVIGFKGKTEYTKRNGYPKLIVHLPKNKECLFKKRTPLVRFTSPPIKMSY